MGCLKRLLGCLVVLVVIAAVVFFTRDRWMKHLPFGLGSDDKSRITLASDWVPLSNEGVVRTTSGLAGLASPRGPVFVSLGGADIASYIVVQLTRQLPAPSDSFQAKVDADRVGLRATMNVKQLGGSVGGVLGSLMGDREHVEMWGTLKVIAPGRAEFHVVDVRIKGIPLPKPLISQLVKPLVRSPQLSGLDENSLPISIPAYVGDVRVANGKITLYKNVQ